MKYRVLAQRRPGREPRRHPVPGRRDVRPHSSLNEGRGANPGDTWKFLTALILVSPRSTKAGARTPATLLLDAGHA